MREPIGMSFATVVIVGLAIVGCAAAAIWAAVGSPHGHGQSSDLLERIEEPEGHPAASPAASQVTDRSQQR